MSTAKLVANGAARQGEQIEIVLTAEQRRTIKAATAQMAKLYRPLVDLV